VRFETPLEAGQEEAAKARIADFRKSFQQQLDKALPE
jgi:hypothetical protein